MGFGRCSRKRSVFPISLFVFAIPVTLYWLVSAMLEVEHLTRQLSPGHLFERQSGRIPAASVIINQGKGNSQCHPHQQVMFIKTHKCASSTVQSILLRYGYNHNLTFALPESGNYLGSPHLFQASLLPKNLLPSDGLADIFAIHTRLNHKEHSKVIHKEARWVTIVREPSALYESLFEYFNMKTLYRFDLRNYKMIRMKSLEALPRYSRTFGKNQMLFDFGYSPEISMSNLVIAIEELDKIFDLVMIVERFEESLILLRHLMCWSLDDLVYFVKNSRRDEVKVPLDEETRQVIRDLNGADSLLYDHFLKKHERMVQEFGYVRMAEEILAFRSLRSQYYERCIERKANGKDPSLKMKEYSDLVDTYVLSDKADKDCRMLTIPEFALIDLVRDNQRARLQHLNGQ